MGRPKGSKNKNTKRTKRPDIPDKEHLIAYLEANSETELPFVEEVWEQAVEKAKENEGKQRPIKTIVTTDKNGNEVVKKQSGGTLVTDPVKYYFRLMGLTQNKKKGIALQEAKIETSETKQEILNTYFDDDLTTEYMDEITSWIALFPPQERMFLKQRYASYMDENDINSGADKAGLKAVLSLEIEMHRIDLKRATGKKIDMNDEKKVRELWDSTLQSLKWTKKQNSGSELNKQNKFSVWLDNMVKNGEFTPNPKHYEEDEVDFILKTIIDSQREMLS